MAGKSNTAEKVRQIVEPIVESLGMELVETEYVKEGTRWFLRLYIDKPGGVSIDDCQLVHENVMDPIDAADPIAGPYVFEVSSPGLDRPLKTERDFLRNIGADIELSLYTADERGKKAYEGVLTQYQEGKITIKEENTQEEYSFTVKELSLVKKAVKF